MMGGQFVEVEGDEGNDRGDGYEKAQSAEYGEEISALSFSVKIETGNEGRPCCKIKKDFHGYARKGGDLGSIAGFPRAEEAAAAGSDNVGPQAQEVSSLIEPFGQNQGSDDEEKKIFFSD